MAASASPIAPSTRQLAKIVAIKEYLPLEFAVRQGRRQVVPRSARLADDFAWGRERFLDEARALARFRHPHIVPVLRLLRGQRHGLYRHGVRGRQEASAELLREPGRRLPPDDVRRLADGLLRGLGAVHAQGFLHRDIKPANIIIRRDGVPVLIDFGAARQAMGGRTRTLTGVLTPQYAPIEQYALDGKQGPWSDIYSAAAVLHHAIAGQAPPDAAARVGKDPYRPLVDTQAGRFEPAFLARSIVRLAFAPDDRPQSVEEWSALFGLSLPSVHDAPTQRLAYAAGVAPPRLGGASRDEAPSPPRHRRRRSRNRAGGRRAPFGDRRPADRRRRLLWRLSSRSSALVLGRRRARSRSRSRPRRRCRSQRRRLLQPTPADPAASAPATGPETSAASRWSSRPSVRPPRRRPCSSVPTMQRGPRASMAGEARIVAARAARPDLPNAERLTVRSGRAISARSPTASAQGLGVARPDQRRTPGRRLGRTISLNGLGTVRLADDTRYAGQWRDGQCRPAWACARSRASNAPKATSSSGRLEGLGVRRTLAEPDLVQSGRIPWRCLWKARASRPSATASATKAASAPASATATAR